MSCTVLCTSTLFEHVLFSESTSLLLTGGHEKILRIFDLNRPDAPPKEVDNSPGSIRTVAWLHSDQTILSSNSDAGGVRLWDLRTEKIARVLETKSPVTSAEVSQDGRYITTADGNSVKFWDANHFGMVKSYTMPCMVESASLEPTMGNMFVAGGGICGFVFLIFIPEKKLLATRDIMARFIVCVLLLVVNHIHLDLKMEQSEYGRR